MLSKKFINRNTYIWTHKVLYTHILISPPKPKPKKRINKVFEKVDVKKY